MGVFQATLSAGGMLFFAVSSSFAFQDHRYVRRIPVWRLFASRVTSATTSNRDLDGHFSSASTDIPSSKKRISSSGILPSIILKRSKQSKAFRNGNPLVFTRAIKQTHGSIKLADLAHVLVETDKADEPSHGIGFGVYNADSLYKVRILCHRYLQPRLYTQVLAAASQEEALRTILEHHLQMSRAKRLSLGLGTVSDAVTSTDTYRLVHGEGDGLSGLAVDMVGPDVAVVMSSAAWCQVHRGTITRALDTVLSLRHDSNAGCKNHHASPTIVWKTTPSRLLQDGYNNVVDEDKEEEVAAVKSSDEPVICKENGILYQTYPFAPVGQKTGVYCDQRENRLSLARLCKGKRVLDLCCYHGGFGLNAVLNGGAFSATLVDSSADAIATCQHNAELNECQDKMTLVHSDITDWMQATFRQGEDFDVVVLDPPKLAPSEKLLEKARRKYHGINRDAIKLVSELNGGILLTCTCSAAMTQKDGGQYFLDMVHGAALAAGRQVTLLRVSGAAPCHTQSPSAFPAGSYLTAALFFVHPVAASL